MNNKIKTVKYCLFYRTIKKKGKSMQKLFYEFVYDIKSQRDKEIKKQMLLEMTDEKFNIIWHLYNGKKIPITKFELRDCIKELDYTEKSSHNSLAEIIDYMYTEDCNCWELTKAMVLYLDTIESEFGWRKCREASRVLFKELRIGISRKEIKKIKMLRKSKKGL